MHFLHATKYEVKGDKAIKSIRQRCAGYLDRAEALKKYLEEKKTAESNPQPVASANKSGGGSGKDNSEEDKLAGALESAIVVETPNVHWDDIVGIESKNIFTKFLVSDFYQNHNFTSFFFNFQS